MRQLQADAIREILNRKLALSQNCHRPARRLDWVCYERVLAEKKDSSNGREHLHETRAPMPSLIGFRGIQESAAKVVLANMSVSHIIGES